MLLPAALWPENSPVIHRAGGCVIPRFSLNGYRDRKSLAHTGVRSPNRQAYSESLYHLYYPAPLMQQTIPAKVKLHR
jgi:hypothetical protein